MTHTSGVEMVNIPKGWAVIEERLMREFVCDDYATAKSIVDVVSNLAESENHHPEVHFGWGYVLIELYTHDEGTITEKDLQLAHKISIAMEA